MVTDDSEDSQRSPHSKSHDIDLWQKVRDYSKGDPQKKIEAVSMIFNQNKKLPREWLDLACELAGKDQPREVRIALANSFATSSSLTTGQYFSILKALANDPDKEVAQVVDIELARYRQQYDFLDRFSNEFNKAIEEMRAKERTTALNILVQHHDTLRRFGGDIRNGQQEKLGKLASDIHKQRQEIFEQVSGKAFSPLISNIGVANFQSIRGIIEPIPGYYPAAELSDVNTKSQIPPHSKADTYMKRLRRCVPGDESWKEYQDICTDILAYCLVPPLLEPSEQSQSLNGRHKRDLIFQIPHNAGDFWNWLIIKYGLAIVVECKNYAEPLKENQVVITSKYLGKKKLTTLGIMLTRKGLGKSAQQTQIDEWKDNDKMVVCLNDEDLIKMLELREKGQESSKVIDNAIRRLLERV
jgi:hypothetical protein